MLDQINVCLVQQAPVFFDLRQTLALACRLISQHAKDGLDLIVFPESWLCGYPVWLDLAPAAGLWDQPGAKQLFRLLYESAISIDSEAVASLSAVAQLSGVTVVMGAHERRGKTLYNTMFYFTPDGKVVPHRKLVPTYTERLVWGRGDGSTLKTVEAPFGTLGGLICWEHWMPLARATMQGQHELVHVAQWPEVGELHRLASRHYAFEGSCFVLASGCYFTKGDLLSGLEGLGDAAGETGAARELLASIAFEDGTPLRRGLSVIYCPNGQVVIEAEAGSEPVLAKLDLRSAIEARMTLDTSGHYARPDIFCLNVDTSSQENLIFGSGESR